MITLSPNVDYTRYRQALQALQNGQSVQEAKALVKPPKEKEETEDVRQLFQDIADNWEDESRVQTLIMQLNAANLQISREAQLLLELLGIYENGQFVRVSEGVEFTTTEFSFRLFQQGYRLAPQVIFESTFERGKYAIILHHLARLPAETEEATVEAVEATIGDVQDIYKQLQFESSSFIPGILRSFQIIHDPGSEEKGKFDNEDEFISPDEEDLNVARFIVRYVKASQYLLARYAGEFERAERLLSDWMRPKYAGTVNCLKTFDSLNWLGTVDTLEQTLEIWNQTCIQSIRDYVSSVQDTKRRQQLIETYVALGMGGPGGSIYEWRIFSEPPENQYTPFFPVPVPADIGGTQTLDFFPDYKQWLMLAKQIMSAQPTRDAATNLRRRMQDKAETIWSKLQYDDDRAKLYFSSDVFQMFFERGVKLSNFNFRGILPTFYILLKQPPIPFTEFYIDLIPALRALRNLVRWQTLSVRAEPKADEKFQIKMSRLQIEYMFQFAAFIDYIVNVNNKSVYIVNWVDDVSKANAENLYIADMKTQLIEANKMIAFSKFLLDITSENVYIERANDKVIQILDNLYKRHIMELKESQLFIENLYSAPYSVIEPTAPPQVDVSSDPQAEEFLFNLSGDDDDCVLKFRMLVDSVPSTITLFNVGTDKAWPRKTLLNALNHRKNGCVGRILNDIQNVFPKLNLQQRQDLITVSKIVGAYKNNAFVEGWAGKDNINDTPTKNLDILAKGKTQFHVLPIRQLSEAWAYLVQALVAIGRGDGIEQILQKLQQIGFTMEKNFFSANDTFVGTQDIKEDDTKRQEIQQTRLLDAVVSEHQGATSVFALFRKIRESPEFFKEFKEHVSQEQMIHYGLVKLYHGEFIFTTGIASDTVDPDNTSDFVPVFQMPDGTTVPYNEYTERELQKGYEILIKIMMQILSNKPVTHTLQKKKLTK